MLGIGLGITKLSLRAPFSPLTLFAASEQGVWLDPSDLSTLFQDDAGTAPVTAPGQSVGLALDKSQGLVLGPELVTNGTFDANSSANWTLNTWTVANNRLEKTAGDNLRASGTLTSALVSGRYYRVTLEASSFVTACNVFFRTGVGGTSNAGYSIPSGTATHSFVMQATDAHTVIQFFPASTSFSGTIDNISVRELPGNHAKQSIFASRPIYGVEPSTGRRNFLTYTEQFDNAAWVKTGVTVTANAVTAPDGTTTADKLIEDTSTGVHRALLGPSPTIQSGLAYTATVYAKAAERTQLRVTENATTGAFAAFDVSAGTVINSGLGGVGAISDMGDGWYRCEVRFISAGTAGRIDINLQTSGSVSYTGDGTSGIFIWGAQLEPGSTASPYQRVVSQYDVTEAGLPSVAYLFDDLIDDSLNWTAPAGSYTVAWCDTAGNVTIQTAQALSGATDALRTQRMVVYLAINRALTAAETANLTAWFQRKAGV